MFCTSTEALTDFRRKPFFSKENTIRVKKRVQIPEIPKEEKPHLLNKSETLDKIKITDNYTVELAKELTELAKEIEKSKYILKLKDNWDGEGSIGYELSTYKNAITFLVTISNFILSSKNTIIDSPKILPSIDGSIDILWKKEKYDLILTIPKKPDTSIRFYGDNKNYLKEPNKQTIIQGQFPVDSININVLLFLLNT